MSSITTLRSLAKDYANGTLEKDNYRKERTVYLEAILAGDVSVRQKQSTASVTQDRSDSVTQRKPNTTQPSTEATRRFNSKMILLAGGTVLTLIVIIVLMLSSGENENVNPADSEAIVETPAPTRLETTPTAAQDLISSFLSSNMWSVSSMDTFLQDWNNLATTDKTDISNTVEFSQLTSSILKKLVEERALSTIGNPETSLEKQRQLVEFAASIGINDPRISLPQQTNLNNL